MASSVFTLKRGDTRPILEVALTNPDGSAHDLTGSTAWQLHVQLPEGTVFTRDMVKQGLDTAGVLRYTWVATDWEPIDPDDPKLPAPDLLVDLPMEYEVSGGSSSRLTFPNGSYDTLRIKRDVG